MTGFYNIKMVQVFYTRIHEQMPQWLYNKYLNLLPPDLQQKNMRLRNWKDRLLQLSGKILLLDALRQFGVSAGCLHDLRYNEYSRPYLPGDIDFNISHSGNYVLCAVGKNVQLGVDIEQIKNISFDDFENVMNAEQWQRIKNSHNQLQQFYNYWAIKESVIKADSRGLSLPLKKIFIENNTALCDNKTWYLIELNIHSDYCSFLAVNKESSLTMEERTYQQLYSV